MAVRACSTQVVAWPPSRTQKTACRSFATARNPYSAGPGSGLVGEMSPCSYRRFVADRYVLANGVGVLPDVFTVTCRPYSVSSVPVEPASSHHRGHHEVRHHGQS